jgi:spore coat protein U-like protein
VTEAARRTARRAPSPRVLLAPEAAAQDHDFCVGIDSTDPLGVDPVAGDYADTVAVDVTF